MSHSASCRVCVPLGVHRGFHHPLVGEGVKHLHVAQVFVAIMAPNRVNLAYGNQHQTGMNVSLYAATSCAFWSVIVWTPVTRLTSDRNDTHMTPPAVHFRTKEPTVLRDGVTLDAAERVTRTPPAPHTEQNPWRTKALARWENTHHTLRTHNATCDHLLANEKLLYLIKSDYVISSCYKT